MNKLEIRDTAKFIAVAFLLFCISCAASAEIDNTPVEPLPSGQAAADEPTEPDVPPTPQAPNLQAELLDERGKTTTSPLGTFDFRNFTYPLPRGWQHQDGDEIVLVNGVLEPNFREITEEMTPDEKAAARSERRIGMSYVTTKYLDADNDGEDEAAVILKIETGGSAIPQLVYIYGWKDGQPELQWSFRTGDRTDGGLKDIRAENGELVIELYGQDRFMLGQIETGKITGDEADLCCPSHFTRTFYKWNGRHFLLQRKRLTYETANPDAPPLENLGDIVNDPVKSKAWFEALEKKKAQ
jgi:hypothetical protein